MLKPQVVIFHEDDIDKIIQECLIHPFCKILIAVRPSDIKDTALKFLERIDSKTLARQFRMSMNCAIANFTNGAELNIISNSVQSRGHKASKIYCSSDTSIEVYFEILRPQLLDYERILRCIKTEEIEND